VEAAQKSPCFADYETPQFWVMDMEKEGIRCWLAAWADNPTNAWMLSHDIRTGLAASFRSLGIAPHRFIIKTPPQTAGSGETDRHSPAQSTADAGD
jgi:small-conductance mechanosensitive channel